MLDAAHEMGLEWSDIITLAAVSDLPKLRFLVLKRNCPMHTGALAFAACKSNSADTLQWLHSMGEQLTEDHFCRAAHFNCVAAMAFLYSIGCQAIPSVAQEAAACPSAEPLRWLLSSTYYKLNPAEDSLAAAHGGSVQVLQFLQPLAHWNAQMLTQLLQAAGAHKRLAAAQWLREQGAAWPVRLQDRWGKQWRGPCLEWARSEGCDLPVAAAASSASSDSASGNNSSLGSSSSSSKPSTVTTRVLLAAPGSLSWMIAAVFLVACLSASAYCWSLQTAQNASNSHTSILLSKLHQHCCVLCTSLHPLHAPICVHARAARMHAYDAHTTATATAAAAAARTASDYQQPAALLSRGVWQYRDCCGALSRALAMEASQCKTLAGVTQQYCELLSYQAHAETGI
eukprot:11208-Heterococcus_DN1.PRE.1